MSVVIWRCPECERVEPETARWPSRSVGSTCRGYRHHLVGDCSHEPVLFERYVGLDESEQEILRAVLNDEGKVFTPDERVRWAHVRTAIGYVS